MPRFGLKVTDCLACEALPWATTMTTTEPTPAPGDAPYPSMRRPQVLDAAVRLLALGGDRALTYRTVDRAADVPPGTTSNHFRTRAALLIGAARHTERQRRRAFDALLAQHKPTTTGQLAKMLRNYLADAASEHSRAGILARAHTALLPMARAHPDIAELLTTNRRHHINALRHQLTAISPEAPPRLATLIANYLTGTLATHHASPDTKIDTTGLTALIELLTAKPSPVTRALW